MHVYVGESHFEDGGICQRFYAARYSSQVFNDLPWGDELFDCAILPVDADLALQVAEDIADDVVRCNVDWVSTTGPEAKQLHDRIDVASVRIGRQNKVGDGDPMTAWHEDAVTLAQMVEIAASGSSGAEYVLALVIGDDAHLSAVIEQMRQFLNDRGD